MSLLSQSRSDTTPRLRLCFVCLGNICRSPTAEAVMRSLLQREGLHETIEVDSAGTSGWHVGDPPDVRAAAEARRRGVVMDGCARRFEPRDFDVFDLILAMDRDNVDALNKLTRKPELRAKVRLLREFDPDRPPHEDADVPDPYYCGDDGFAYVFDLIDAACKGLLEHLVRTYEL